MTIAFQLAVFALIAISLILLISVPVVFSSPGGWSTNKSLGFWHQHSSIRGSLFGVFESRIQTAFS